ncbi:hypothetical protein [Streptomyces sp. NPDC101165]|uniref:hypothetical protein n=1 Tax=Streptomyces sp. NPDC101165 TaxID=3366119 RepID=UPI0038034786
MNHTFGRRAVTTAVTLAAAAGTLLALGTAASAAPNPAGVVAPASNVTPYGDRHGERSDHGDSWNEQDGHDRRDGWNDLSEYRGGHHSDHRFDGHRHGEREVRYWYSNDQSRRHQTDGRRFYQGERGRWIVVISDSHGFDGSNFH